MAKKLNIYVSMTDKCMSGWGMTKGQISKFVIVCHSWKEADYAEYQALRASEMSRVTVYRTKPYFAPKTHNVQFEEVEEAPRFNAGWLYTTSHYQNIDSFVNLEVKERKNYTFSMVKEWVEKYKIKQTSSLIWVTDRRWKAAKYKMDAKDWNNAEEIFNKSDDDFDVEEVSTLYGVKIEESADGDGGFLFMLY